MPEHPTSQILNQYQQRTLSPDAFLAIHRHVVSCPVCSAHGTSSIQKVEDYAQLLSALTASPADEPYHLSPAEISAYAQQTLGEIDRENAESHLEVCDECGAKMRKAYELQKPSLPTLPASMPDTASAGFQQSTGDNRAHLFERRPIQLAALFSLIAAIVVLALLFFRAKPDNQTVKQTPSQNSNANAANGNDEGERASQPTEGQPLPETAANPVLQLDDGGQKIVLDNQGEVKGVEHLPQRLQQTIKAVLLTQRLERPSLPELNGKAGTLLSESDNGLPFQLVSPMGKVVSVNRPTFRWRALAGAGSYTVTVTDAQLNVVATSEALTALEWKIPVALKGGIYSWQVTAMKDGERITSPTLPAPQAKFKVLEQDKAEELARARQTFARSHLTLGVLYTQAGLFDEAEREFQLLSQANPNSSLTRKLLAQVRAMRRGQ